MTTIKIALNSGPVIELPCNSSIPIQDVHTLARQISECPLVYSTHIGMITYAYGKERGA